MAVYSYDAPERFVAGIVEQPGTEAGRPERRTFCLQASAAGRVTSVAVEKFQVTMLAHYPRLN